MTQVLGIVTNQLIEKIKITTAKQTVFVGKHWG